jgi:NAD(P)-dependent dehydrogenase (short-subunit alcohol dehydrogenase family)
VTLRVVGKRRVSTRSNQPGGLVLTDVRTAVVTGATSGIGRMIAEAFIEDGWFVIICGRDPEKCATVSAELNSIGRGGCLGVSCDLSGERGINELFESVRQVSESVHVLVNNAGVVSVAPLESTTVDDWDRVMNVNLKAAFFLSQSLRALLKKGATRDRPSAIINIGSIGGIIVGPKENYAYGASKAGLHHLTKSLAKRLGPEGITVNAIAAGYFPSAITQREVSPRDLQTLAEKTPLGRIGQPRDIAGLARFLASENAGFLSGAVIPLDGGASL